MFNRRDDGNIYPRKKSRGPLGFILIGLLVVLAVAYIIYAINLPEPQPFANITPGASADLATATPDSEQPSPTPLAGVHYSMTSGGETTGSALSSAPLETADAENPTAAAVSSFEDRWQYAYQTMAEVKSFKDISYAFPVMDIAHADMMRNLDELAALPLSSQESNQTEGSNYIRPLSSGQDVYEFQLHDQTGRRIRGQVNAMDQSFYYEVDGLGGSVDRYLEVLQVGDITYAQLLMRDGPYPGILYYELTVGGDLRCAYLSASLLQEQPGNNPIRHFGEAPNSWDAYIGNAIPYFSALREEIVTGVTDNQNIPPDENNNQGAESSDNSGGARVAASTPRPASASRRVKEDTELADLPEENAADLPELDDEGNDASTSGNTSATDGIPADLPADTGAGDVVAMP